MASPLQTDERLDSSAYHLESIQHTCGAILPILPGLVDAGFDIINPVQINAKDMDPRVLKKSSATR